jgi:hypothetical protein
MPQPDHHISPFRDDPAEKNPSLDHYATLSEALRAKNDSLAGRLDEVHVWLTVDEAEEVITTLYEMIGHMAEDVGSQGYEYRLLHRVRRHARMLQASLLASILPLSSDAEVDEVRRADISLAHNGLSGTARQ